MIKVHKQVWYILAFFLGFFLYDVAFAGAFYERIPNISGIDLSQSEVTIYADSWQPFCASYPSTTHFRYRVLLGDNTWIWIGNPTPLGGTLSAVITAQSLGYTDNVNIVDGYLSCYDAVNDVFTDYNAQNLYDNYVLLYTAPPQSGAISFVDFADVSTEDMIASVRAGTQETTQGALPLMVFVGIPLAFVILGGVSYLISNSVKEEKKQKSGFNRRAFNRKANELENFYSKKGTSGAPYDIK